MYIKQRHLSAVTAELICVFSYVSILLQWLKSNCLNIFLILQYLLHCTLEPKERNGPVNAHLIWTALLED